MPFRALPKKIIAYFGLAILVVDILSISYFRILDRFELVTLDFRYGLRLIFPQKINPDIAVVEISEDTLRFLGKWPLPRDYHASLIEVLSKFGARTIIFDILFCEPTGWDKVLVESAKKAGNVYFPFAFRLGDRPGRTALEAVEVDAPILPDLKEAAKGVGFINKIIDRDGKVRRTPLIIKFHGKEYRSLALQAADDYLGRGTAAAAGAPVDENGAILLNFAGRWEETFRHYSYLDILAAYQESQEGKTPRLGPAELNGKVCFVGLTATGTQELGPIPVQNSYPMLGVHANLFNMLTQKSYLRRAPRFVNVLALVILAGCLLFFMRRLRPFTAFFALLGTMSLLFIGSATAFIFAGLWMDIVCPSIVLFAAYIGVTINRYVNEITTRERMQKELAIAASIQKCFLPAGIPLLEGLDIAAEMKTAKEVGGDLYDFVGIDDHRLGVMLGDVSGKGVPASLFMARVETLFKVYSKSGEGPSSVISKLNGEVSCDERSGMFTTLIYAVFDVKKKALVFSDAGHLPLILVRANEAKRLVSDDGMAVGIMPDTTFSEQEVGLSAGDVAVFYTDGVTEARDVKGNEFGAERLIDLVTAARDLPATKIAGRILEGLRRFQGKAVQHDDITVIIVKVLPS
ncbi:MAG: CHASE2 domain-containing protein [Candidatus Omnitrophica bacterium]|nr:CHASE2 domain-containing protein [Candidatus Omnitrophota bacterium]